LETEPSGLAVVLRHLTGLTVIDGGQGGGYAMSAVSKERTDNGSTGLFDSREPLAQKMMRPLSWGDVDSGAPSAAAAGPICEPGPGLIICLIICLITRMMKGLSWAFTHPRVHNPSGRPD